MNPSQEVDLLTLLDSIQRMDDLDATWLAVSTLLLQFCDSHNNTPQDWGLPIGEPQSAIMATEALFIAEVLESGGSNPTENSSSAFASADHRMALQRVAREALAQYRFATTNFTSLIVARGIAGGIDEMFGHTYIEWFRNELEVAVTAGNVHPILAHDPRRWIGEHKPNSNISSLPSRDLARSPRLQIAPKSASTIGFVLDFSFWHRLSMLGDSTGLSAATLQPNLRLHEFDVVKNEGEPPTYTNSGPSDPRIQAARVLNLIRDAGERDTPVALLPEYSLSQQAAELVESGIEDLERCPVLVVAGISGEPDGDGRVRNEVWVHIGADFATRGRWARLPGKLYGATIEGYQEGIAAGTEVRVLCCESFTVAILTCRDCLDGALIDQLAAIGVNLLLVPAMTPKTASMIGSATRLSQQSQAFVVMAVGPALWVDTENDDLPSRYVPHRAEATFAGPYADGSPTRCLPDHHLCPGVDEVGSWHFDFSTRSAQWFPEPNTTIDNN